MGNRGRRSRSSPGGKRLDGGGELADLRFSDQFKQAEADAYEIGIDAEFWRLTPREWGLAVKAHNAREERKDYRTALICATVVNFSPVKDQKTKMCEPSDFMPSKVKPKKAQTEDEMLMVVRALNAAFGGKVVES